MSTSQKNYELHVVGGNSRVNRPKLRISVSGTLEVSANAADPPCTVQWDTRYDGSRRLRVPTSSNTDVSFYTLQGPSGKGEYRINVTNKSEPEGFLIGSRVLYNEWDFIQDGKRLLLRCLENASTSRWIAVKDVDDAGAETWTPWWYSPNAANMDDFKFYVAIDIEAFEVA